MSVFGSGGDPNSDLLKENPNGYGYGGSEPNANAWGGRADQDAKPGFVGPNPGVWGGKEAAPGQYTGKYIPDPNNPDVPMPENQEQYDRETRPTLSGRAEDVNRYRLMGDAERGNRLDLGRAQIYNNYGVQATHGAGANFDAAGGNFDSANLALAKVDYDRYLAGQSRNQQNQALDLSYGAAQGNAPSRAEILGRGMTQQSLQAQAAGAASARGGSLNQLSAQRNAQAGAAQFQAQSTNQMAALRADEMERARQQYMSGATNVRGQDLQGGQLALGQGQALTQIGQGQVQAGQGRIQQGQTYGNLAGNEGKWATDERQLQQQGQLGYEQLGFNTNKEALAAQSGTRQFNSDEYWRDQQANERDKQQDIDLASGIGGSAMGLFGMLSDIRAKQPYAGGEKGRSLMSQTQQPFMKMMGRFAGDQRAEKAEHQTRLAKSGPAKSVREAMPQTASVGSQQPRQGNQPLGGTNMMAQQAPFQSAPSQSTPLQYGGSQASTNSANQVQPAQWLQDYAKSDFGEGPPVTHTSQEPSTSSADDAATEVLAGADDGPIGGRDDPYSAGTPGEIQREDPYGSGETYYSDMRTKTGAGYYSDNRAKLQEAFEAGVQHADTTGANQPTQLPGYVRVPNRAESSGSPRTMMIDHPKDATRKMTQEEKPAVVRLPPRASPRPPTGQTGSGTTPATPVPNEDLDANTRRSLQKAREKGDLGAFNQTGSAPLDLRADANRKQAGFPYSYQDKYTPPEQGRGELNYGFSAQELASNPITATAVKSDDGGMLRVDPNKLQKVQSDSIASLQQQIDEMNQRGGYSYG